MKWRIRSSGHATAYPMKYAVYCDPWGFSKWWIVCQGETYLGKFPTHAEALAYAIKEAGA